MGTVVLCEKSLWELTWYLFIAKEGWKIAKYKISPQKIAKDFLNCAQGFQNVTISGHTAAERHETD